jgi:hypothetical protein
MKDSGRMWYCAACDLIWDITHPTVKIISGPSVSRCLIEVDRRAHSLIYTTLARIHKRQELNNHATGVTPSALQVQKLKAETLVDPQQPVLEAGEKDGER